MELLVMALVGIVIVGGLYIWLMKRPISTIQNIPAQPEPPVSSYQNSAYGRQTSDWPPAVSPNYLRRVSPDATPVTPPAPPSDHRFRDGAVVGGLTGVAAGVAAAVVIDEMIHRNREAHRDSINPWQPQVTPTDLNPYGREAYRGDPDLDRSYIPDPIRTYDPEPSKPDLDLSTSFRSQPERSSPDLDLSDSSRDSTSDLNISDTGRSSSGDLDLSGSNRDSSSDLDFSNSSDSQSDVDLSMDSNRSDDV